MNPIIKTAPANNTGVPHIPVICDVCGESRRSRHHPKCSKIRQQWYLGARQQEGN